ACPVAVSGKLPGWMVCPFMTEYGYFHEALGQISAGLANVNAGCRINSHATGGGWPEAAIPIALGIAFKAVSGECSSCATRPYSVGPAVGLRATVRPGESATPANGSRRTCPALGTLSPTPLGWHGHKLAGSGLRLNCAPAAPQLDSRDP